jgi:GT2 family glycosyltransferase
MSQPLVYCVTLNWNRGQDTLTCLRSLQQLTYPLTRLLVVDNGSTDGSVELIKARMPQVQVLQNRTNRGFAAGANQAISYALAQGADYVLLVNNDTFLEPQSLDELLAEARPDVGMLAPKIYYHEPADRIWSVGYDQHPVLLEMRGGGRGMLDRGQYDQVREVDYLLGCGLLVSRSFLQKVGLFDTRYFVYYEDLDLSLRARKHNYRLLCVPRARMWHKVSASTGLDSPLRRYHMAKSSVIFFFEHGRGFCLPFIVLYRFGSTLCTLGRLFFRRDKASAIAHLRGLRDGLCQIMS